MILASVQGVFILSFFALVLLTTAVAFFFDNREKRKFAQQQQAAIAAQEAARIAAIPTNRRRTLEYHIAQKRLELAHFEEELEAVRQAEYIAACEQPEGSRNP